jgi:iron complex outermembrane receptor protein
MQLASAGRHKPFAKRSPIAAGMLAILVVILLPLPVRAQSGPDLSDVPLEKLIETEVVSADRIARQISDSPSAVSIVTAEDIRAYGYRTLGEILNSMRGLYVTSDLRYEYLGGRAYGSTDDFAGRVMLMIDGYATQDNIYSTIFLGNDGFLDVELIDRVEYVSGTGSVTYGNNALLGIVNVVTKKGADFNGAQVSVGRGSYGVNQQRATFGKKYANGTDVLFSVSTLDRDGRNHFFPGATTYGNNGIASGLDWEKNKRFFGKIEYGSWTFETAYVDRKRPRTYVDPDSTKFNGSSYLWDENFFISARHNTQLTPHLNSTTRIYHGAYADKSQREFSDASDGIAFRRQKSEGQWAGIDIKLAYDGFHNQKILVGAEYRHDFTRSMIMQFLSPDQGPSWKEPVNEHYPLRTFSFYIANEIAISPNLKANIGLRRDMPSDEKHSPPTNSPRLALIYSPSSETTWKASYSKAFRSPNGNEMSWWIVPLPERVQATELLLQHRLSPLSQFTISAYKYRLSDLRFDDVEGNPRPDGESKSRGIEVEFERKWLNGARMRLSGTWRKTVDVFNEPLANAPNFIGKAHVGFPVFDNSMRVGIEGLYLGSRWSIKDDEWFPDTPRKKLNGTGIVNLTLSSERKWHGLSASFSIRNLFDKKYDVVAPFMIGPSSDSGQSTLRMDGRNYWLQLDFDF